MGNEQCCAREDRNDEFFEAEHSPRRQGDLQNRQYKTNNQSNGGDTFTQNPQYVSVGVGTCNELLPHSGSNSPINKRKGKNERILNKKQESSNKLENSEDSQAEAGVRPAVSGSLRKKLFAGINPKILALYQTHHTKLIVSPSYAGSGNPMSKKVIKIDQRDSYVGQVSENDRPNGYGIMVLDRTMILEGIFKNGKLEGPGIEVIGERFYLGDYTKGHIEGPGKIYFDTGSVFTGTFKQGLREGKGEEYLEGQKHFVGQFREDKEFGDVKIVWESLGSKYVGKMEEGKFHGKGFFDWGEGKTYDGEWFEGEMQGRGKYTYPNGDAFEGNFQNGEKVGKGVLTKKDGTKYTGEFINGRLEGEVEVRPASGGSVKKVEFEKGRPAEKIN